MNAPSRKIQRRVTVVDLHQDLNERSARLGVCPNEARRILMGITRVETHKKHVDK